MNSQHERVLNRLHDEWMQACFKDPTSRIATPADVRFLTRWVDVFAQQLNDAQDEQLLALLDILRVHGGDFLEQLACEHAGVQVQAALEDEREAG